MKNFNKKISIFTIFFLLANHSFGIESNPKVPDQLDSLNKTTKETENLNTHSFEKKLEQESKIDDQTKHNLNVENEKHNKEKHDKTISDKAHDAKESIKGAVHNISEKIKDKASDAFEKTKDIAEDLSDNLKDKGKKVKKKFRETKEKFSDRIANAYEKLKPHAAKNELWGQKLDKWSKENSRPSVYKAIKTNDHEYTFIGSNDIEAGFLFIVNNLGKIYEFKGPGIARKVLINKDIKKLVSRNSESKFISDDEFGIELKEIGDNLTSKHLVIFKLENNTNSIKSIRSIPIKGGNRYVIDYSKIIDNNDVVGDLIDKWKGIDYKYKVVNLRKDKDGTIHIKGELKLDLNNIKSHSESKLLNKLGFSSKKEKYELIIRPDGEQILNGNQTIKDMIDHEEKKYEFELVR